MTGYVKVNSGQSGENLHGMLGEDGTQEMAIPNDVRVYIYK
jgi:hypothetical protein